MEFAIREQSHNIAFNQRHTIPLSTLCATFTVLILYHKTPPFVNTFCKKKVVVYPTTICLWHEPKSVPLVLVLGRNSDNGTKKKSQYKDNARCEPKTDCGSFSPQEREQIVPHCREHPTTETRDAEREREGEKDSPHDNSNGNTPSAPAAKSSPISHSC